MANEDEGGPLSPASIGFLSTLLSFVLAAVLHPQEMMCFPFLFVYYITIPSMYLLLVIYSLWNLWNVSWGTREVQTKKTKAELEAEKKRQEKAATEAKKNKGGLLGSLMDHVSGKGGTDGGIEFGFANLFRCMCFTHDDPMEPKKQLVKIAATLDDVSTRMARIESTVGTVGSFRRRSSLKRRSMNSLPEMPEDQPPVDADDLPSQQSDYGDDIQDVQKAQRNDEENPYWIEDTDLGSGPVDFLPGPEVNFFRELIEKYLQPIVKDEEKEKKDTEELKAMRDRAVFTFIMLNACFVLLIYMLQFQKELVSIPWPMPPTWRYNVTYDSKDHSFAIGVTKPTLEPIGLVFLVLFTLLLAVQIVGMLFHRWETGRRLTH